MLIRFLHLPTSNFFSLQNESGMSWWFCHNIFKLSMKVMCIYSKLGNATYSSHIFIDWVNNIDFTFPNNLAFTIPNNWEKKIYVGNKKLRQTWERLKLNCILKNHMASTTWSKLMKALRRKETNHPSIEEKLCGSTEVSFFKFNSL